MKVDPHSVSSLRMCPVFVSNQSQIWENDVWLSFLIKEMHLKTCSTFEVYLGVDDVGDLCVKS